MSKRLHVILSDEEYRRYESIAKKEGIAFGELVRRGLRVMERSKSGRTASEKVAAIDKAYTYSFPVSDIEQMNREIEEGQQLGLP